MDDIVTDRQTADRQQTDSLTDWLTQWPWSAISRVAFATKPSSSWLIERMTSTAGESRHGRDQHDIEYCEIVTAPHIIYNVLTQQAKSANNGRQSRHHPARSQDSSNSSSNCSCSSTESSQGRASGGQQGKPTRDNREVDWENGNYYLKPFLPRFGQKIFLLN